MSVENTETQTPVESQEASERPEWLPAKYATAEQLAMGYEAAQKKITELSQQLAQGGATETPESTAGDDVADAPAASEGEDTPNASEGSEDQPGGQPEGVQKFYDEYAKEGRLSEDSYANLVKQGFDKETVDSFIEFQTNHNPLFETVGGRAEWTKIAQWASEGADPKLVVEHDEVVKTKNNTAIKLSMKRLQEEYVKANGSSPKLHQGTQKPSGGIKPFRSAAEMTKAMSDKRYATDAAYRKDVIARIEISNY